jgi:oxygen-independent coproporphyrinogen-3 oxidase
VYSADLERQYIEALSREIAGSTWAWTPETVYLGGGTPSNLDPAGLKHLLDLIPGRPWAEATMEAAPGGITAEKARAWAAAGIDRVSLGVQSFVEREVRLTGRKHNAEIVAREITTLHDAGIRNINIDLIAGLAAQTAESWNESLDWVERLQPEHVSVYMLEVDEDSRLGKEMLLGGVRYGASNTPSEDQTAAFYETAVERLSALGIPRYEISNFARPGFESRHNLKYWRLEPYVGFGADAHSYDGHFRCQNAESIQEYLAGAAIDPVEAGDDERFFVGLRLSEGVRPTTDDWRRYDQPIRELVGAGLLESSDGVIRLTSRGVMVSNDVFQEFLTT